MLWEWLTAMRAQCPAYVRRLGLLRELVAIEARGRRCHKHWAPHLERSKSLIARSAEKAPGDRLAVVLGSGPLFDIPLETLAARFETVILADVAHLPRAGKRARKLGNARLAVLDVTGMLERTMRAAARGDGDLTVDEPTAFLDLAPDFVVSANLASQLPLPFARMLARSANPAHREEAFARAFSRSLIEAHFFWLSRFSGRVCLIADLTWISADGDAILAEKDALCGVRPPSGGERWLWDVAPRGEHSWEYERRNLVAGFEDFGAALAPGGRSRDAACG